MNPEQISDHPRSRLAMVSVRQSSVHAVVHCQKSQRGQRHLVEQAMRLGWLPEPIQVVDDDPGQSGSRRGQRSGIAERVRRTALGQIGLILALEVTPLARRHGEGDPLFWRVTWPDGTPTNRRSHRADPPGPEGLLKPRALGARRSPSVLHERLNLLRVLARVDPVLEAGPNLTSKGKPHGRANPTVRDQPRRLGQPTVEDRACAFAPGGCPSPGPEGPGCAPSAKSQSSPQEKGDC